MPRRKQVSDYEIRPDQKRPRRLNLPLSGHSDISATRKIFKPSKTPSETPSYIYEALPSLRGQVRLLKLLPANRTRQVHGSWSASHARPFQLEAERRLRKDESETEYGLDLLLEKELPIQGTLLVENLADRPTVEYTAISHVWDRKAPPWPLLVDGRSVNITQDLACLLLRLRSDAGAAPVYVWIDTICINQNDTEERSFQVQQMDLIYRKAADVTIWLGETSDTPSRYANGSAAVLHSLAQGTGLKDLFSPDAFRELLHHPWFGRMWIVQEAALARTLTVRSGWASCSWEKFWNAAAAFDHEHTVQGEAMDSQDSTRSHGILGASFRHYAPLALNEIRETVQAGRRNLQIVPLLLRCKLRNATNKKDKIFGLLGLLSETSKSARWENFIPNYYQPLHMIYKDFTVWCVEQTGTLDIMSTGVPLTAPRGFRIPSWTVDWGNRYLQPAMGDLLEPPRYAVGMRRKAEIQYPRDRSDAIFLPGVYFDEVVSLARTVMEHHMSREQKLDVWVDWRKTILADSTEEKRRSLKYSFWTAIITDTENSVLKTNPIFSPTMCLLTTQTIDNLDDAVKNSDDASELTLNRLWYFAEYVMGRRKPFLTSRGFIGLADPGVEVGDKVCILWGGRMFFLLRELGSLSIDQKRFKSHQLVDGRVYVQDLMYGEGQDVAEAEAFPDEDFCII